MAAPTKEETGSNCTIHTWNLTSADPTGDAIELPMASDRTIQFTGTWGTATAGIEGSLDGVTFLPLTDPSSTVISKTANSIEAVLENVRYIRPVLSTPGAGATVKAVLMSRNQR